MIFTAIFGSLVSIANFATSAFINLLPNFLGNISANLVPFGQSLQFISWIIPINSIVAIATIMGSFYLAMSLAWVASVGISALQSLIGFSIQEIITVFSHLIP